MPYRTFPRLLSLLLVGVLLIAGTAHAQERDSSEPRVSPNAEVHQTIGTTDVRVTYGRPGVRGRDIFGDLVPYDTVWRTGANEATTVTFSGDVRVGDAAIPAGTYSLYTIPSEDDMWTVILNTNANQWGAYNYSADADQARIPAEAYRADTFREQLAFTFEAVDETSATLLMHWADTALPIPITVADAE